MNDEHKFAIVFLSLMCFAFGILIGFSIGLGGSDHLDIQRVETDPMTCRLDRHNNAQKYLHTCSSVFKAAIHE